MQHLTADGCQTLNMDDTELINQILNGNLHAFTFLVNRYQKLVVHITGRLIQRHDELEDVCQELNLPAGYEFGFNAMGSSAKLREKVFGVLTKADYAAWAIVVDKTTLPDLFKLMNRLDFYLFFITELLQAIPAGQREGATLILDEFGGALFPRPDSRRRARWQLRKRQRSDR